MKRLLFALAFLLLSSVAWAAPDADHDADRAPADFPVITPATDDYWILTDTSNSGRFSKVLTSGVRAAIGLGTSDNPSWNSVHASGGNLAAANAQVTKKWITGLQYTADVTSVIHGGKHFICYSTHTASAAGATGNEPGVGDAWATVWKYAGEVIDASGFNGNLATTDDTLQEVAQKLDDLVAGGDDLGSAAASDIVALFGSGSCSGYLYSDGTCSTPSGAAHDAVTLGTDVDTVLGLSTQQLTLDSQTANYFFAAPNGSAGDPTFRAIVAADIPTLNQNTTGTAAGLAAQYIDWNASSGGTSIANKPNVVISGSSGYVFNMGALSDLQYNGNTLIDDTATNGATTRLWSVDKVYDELALKATLASPQFTTAIGILSSNDPDLTTEGWLSWDANGDVLRGYDGTRQVAVAKAQKEIQVTVIKPNDLDDAQRDAFLVWSNNSGMSFVVTGWYAWSTSDDTDLNIEETDGDGANNATVDAVSIATNGTGIYYANDSTITAGTIENGHLIWLDFDDTDAPAQVHVTIYGYYNADVN